MSELTPCNLCTLNRIKRDAEKRNAVVTTELTRLEGNERMGWWKVIISDRDKPVAFLQEIPDRCVC